MLWPCEEKGRARGLPLSEEGGISGSGVDCPPGVYTYGHREGTADYVAK